MRGLTEVMAFESCHESDLYGVRRRDKTQISNQVRSQKASRKLAKPQHPDDSIIDFGRFREQALTAKKSAHELSRTYLLQRRHFLAELFLAVPPLWIFPTGFVDVLVFLLVF